MFTFRLGSLQKLIQNAQSALIILKQLLAFGQELVGGSKMGRGGLSGGMVNGGVSGGGNFGGGGMFGGMGQGGMPGGMASGGMQGYGSLKWGGGNRPMWKSLGVIESIGKLEPFLHAA